VPCGIFDDPVRVALLKEDGATIRKAMVQVVAVPAYTVVGGAVGVVQWRGPSCPPPNLPKSPCVQVTALAADTAPLSLNQAVRWVSVKEQHASNIITMVSEYMLCQRVKKADEGWMVDGG